MRSTDSCYDDGATMDDFGRRTAGRSKVAAYRCLGAFVILIAVTACGDDGVTVDPTLPEATQWQEDLAFLVDRLEALHPNLYHTVDRNTLDAARSQLHQAIPGMSDHEVFVELLRLITLVARERDGHMALSYFEGTGFGIVPIQLYRFADGVFVVDARPELEHLIGSKLVGIGGRGLAEVDQLIDPLIPRDNDNSLIGYRNLAYVTPDILAVLGIVADAANPVYQFASGEGQTSEALSAVAPNEYGLESIFNLPTPTNAPLYLTRRAETFWLQHLEDDGVLYLRFNRLRPTSGSEDLAAFGQRALSIVQDGGVERVIVDLRQNNGGNNQLIDGILEALTNPLIDQVGRLVVFTDRHTFSAAGNLVAAIADETNARFEGVSPGGSGSQFGDAERVVLPYSGVAAFIPTRHWVFGDPSFQPLQHPMDLMLEPTAADFFARKDPLLDRYLGATRN